MSDNLINCSAIEQRIDGQNLYISTTEDQLHKLDSLIRAILIFKTNGTL